MLKAFLLIFLMGCGLATTRPKLEMTLAATAYVAARDSGAPSLASQEFRKAEALYLKAKASYRRKYFNKAKQYAILSKKFSEKAEYLAMKKKLFEARE